MSNPTDIDLVTMFVNDVQFGVPVLQVRDVLDSPATYPVPLAPPEIKGSINLRGRIASGKLERATCVQKLHPKRTRAPCSEPLSLMSPR